MSELTQRMTEAASAFLDSLSAQQRQLAQRPFDDAQREVWYYTPTARAGIPLNALDGLQGQKAHRLVGCGLSHSGYARAATIMGLENILDRDERFSGETMLGTEVAQRRRDPMLYFLAIYGDPGADAWGWQFGGHHVTVSHTIVEGELATPTPCFLGANPAEAPLGATQMLRPLAGEQDLGFELLHLLAAERRDRAVVCGVAPHDIVQGNRSVMEDGALPLEFWDLMGFQEDRRADPMERMRQRNGITPETLETVRYHANAPRGVAAAAMNAGEQDALRALIRQYVERMPDDLAEREWAKVEQDFAAVHFAWAGGDTRAEPHYYRLQAPRFVVEFDNTQNDANHIHSVWRDPVDDFGRELLARHYATAH